MYINEISIHNVKLFREVNLSFLEEGQPRKWTVLIGENGLGKTTILQAIAMAASGRDRSNQLANIVSLPRRRIKSAHAEILAVFSFGDLGHNHRSYPRLASRPLVPPKLNTTIAIAPGNAIAMGSSSYTKEENDGGEKFRTAGKFDPKKVRDWFRLDPISQARAKNLPGWFVVGYGVDRRLPSPNNAPKLDDPAFQRMASLFDKGPIMATGFADLFESESRLKVREFTKSVKKALLDNSKVLPRVNDLELRGRSGVSAKRLIEGDRFSFVIGKSTVRIPATWLSQGYQATIAWIADLIGQMFWDAKKPVDVAEMEGLVLIDEIDIHLHPTWQVNLIQALKTTFPRIQFVVTTHSPMVLPGLKKEEILRVRQTEQGSVVVEPVEESPAVMTGSELYDAFFGINGLFAKEIGEQLRKYSYLSSDPFRSDEEDREMRRIQQALKQADVLPEWEPVGREPL